MGPEDIASSFSVLSHLARLSPPLDRLVWPISLTSLFDQSTVEIFDRQSSGKEDSQSILQLWCFTHHIKMKFLLHTALLAAVTIATPTAHWGQEADTNGGRGGYNSWDESSKAASYADFGRAWHHGRGSKRGSCDLKNAVMPAGKNNIHNIQTMYISISNSH